MFYIVTRPKDAGPHQASTPSQFYTGSKLSPEYPDALLYSTRGRAYQALQSARTKFPGEVFAIVDQREESEDIHPDDMPAEFTNYQE